MLTTDTIIKIYKYPYPMKGLADCEVVLKYDYYYYHEVAKFLRKYLKKETQNEETET
jgi:hypothetical protein